MLSLADSRRRGNSADQAHTYRAMHTPPVAHAHYEVDCCREAVVQLEPAGFVVFLLPAFEC